MGRSRQPSRLAALTALMLGAWLLVLQTMPAGFAICVEADGHLQLELVGQACCAPHPPAGADVLPAASRDQCSTCQDLALPHHPTGLVRVPMAPPPQVDLANIVVAVICWPVPTRPAFPAWLAGCRQRPQLVRLATTVIRC